MPDLQIAWHHEYDNTKALVNARDAADTTGETDFANLDASPAKDSAVISAGPMLLRPSNLSLTARYTIEAGSAYVSQAGSLHLQQLFSVCGSEAGL